MATTLIELDIRTKKAWHAWLAKNHASSPGVWLVRHKDHSGVSCMPYEDMVREALCVGWIDSLVRRLDDDRYAIKVTPRKPTSKWSALNRKRYAELKAEGLLAPAGLANSPAGKALAQKPSIAIPELPDYIAAAIKASPAAWRYFQELAPSHRRHYVGWIHIAKRPETRDKRLKESIALLSKGQKLGLK